VQIGGVMTHEEVAAWRAQIDMAQTPEELGRTIAALRNICPELLLLIDAAERKRQLMRDGSLRFPKITSF
jgi:hypothetical protein